MTKGRQAFDADKAEASLARMAAIVDQLPTLWPPDSKPVPPLPRYSSSLKIWDNKSDFDAKLANLAKSIREVRGHVSDPERLGRAVSIIKQACDNCHEVYQITNRQ
jgi:cytochrome c556